MVTAEKKKRARPAYFFLRPGDTGTAMSPYNNLMAWLLNRDTSKHWRIAITEDKEGRSNKQNSLQWRWHAEYGKHHGFSKEESYNKFKYHHCLPIMLADPENEQLRRVWELVRNDKEAVAGLVKALHTGDLDTHQMAEALTEYDQVNAARGLVFTDPADLKRDAKFQE